MKKGHLVYFKPSMRTPGNKGLYIVIRDPYELAISLFILNKPITRLTPCVDVLTPSGDIIKGIACDLLERV